MKVKEESEKVCLKLNIWKTKIMVSGPITSWQIVEEIMETVADFIFLGSKITADSHCSYEIKRHLLLGRKGVTNHRQHIKKWRLYFANRCPSNQNSGFSCSHVWVWELDHREGWALKWKESESDSVVFDSLWPHGLYSPWNSPGQNTGVGNLSLLHGIFQTQGWEPRSPTLQADSLTAEPQGKPY